MHSYPRVRRAEGFWARLRGVGLRVTWQEFDALCLPRCRAIHTFALAKSIDVVFVADDGVILEVRSRVPPWRLLAALEHNVQDAWEFPSGSCERHGVIAGMSIDILLQRGKS